MEQEVAHLEESEYSPEMEGRDATKGGSESSTEDSGGHHEVEDEDASDGYEPPEAESSTSGEDSQCSFPDAAPAEDTPLVEVSDNEIQGVSATTPITQPISTGQQESKPPSPREVDLYSLVLGCLAF